MNTLKVCLDCGGITGQTCFSPRGRHMGALIPADCQITTGGIVKPTPKISPERKAIASAMREVKREMRECGVRRTSCFNGGLDAATYRLNARLFELETILSKTL